MLDLLLVLHVLTRYCVVPDLVPPGDICLGGSCCGKRMGYHDVCHL